MTDPLREKLEALAKEWDGLTEDLVAKNVTGSIMIKIVRARTAEVRALLASEPARKLTGVSYAALVPGTGTGVIRSSPATGPKEGAK
jgi:hypothetical protein